MSLIPKHHTVAQPEMNHLKSIPKCKKKFPYVSEELLRDDAGPGVHRQLHLADLLVDLLHEVDDKVHQLVLVHLLCVEVGDEEADVISLTVTKRKRKKKEKKKAKQSASQLVTKWCSIKAMNSTEARWCIFDRLWQECPELPSQD